MKLALTLEYTLGEGFLAPYLEGLRAGKALAGRCAGCGRVALPPAPTCLCGARRVEMQALSGLATILWRSTGSDGDAALVRFEGADTSALARLEGFRAQARGRIAADPEAGLVLVPEDPA